MKNDGLFKWFIIAVIALMLCLCTAKAVEYVGSVKRFTQNIESNLGGGLPRIVTVYDEHGHLLRQWRGKIDVADDTNLLDFIYNGRRIIIQGGITVIEEEF